MRNSLLILGVFAALVCFENPLRRKTIRVCLLRSRGGRSHELRVRNISTMFGHRERDWRELWAQSHVPVGAKSISVDEAPQALFLLKNHAFAKNTGSLAMSQFDTERTS